MATIPPAPGQRVIALLGDLAAVDELRSVPGPSPPPRDRRVALAVADASIAQIAAGQVPQLRALDPSVVVVQLGPRDLLDGFDESYFHAGVVQVCDGIQQAAPAASVTIVAVPHSIWSSVTTTRDRLEARWRQFNAAAEVTANLRGFQFRQRRQSA